MDRPSPITQYKLSDDTQFGTSSQHQPRRVPQLRPADKQLLRCCKVLGVEILITVSSNSYTPAELLRVPEILICGRRFETRVQGLKNMRRNTCLTGFDCCKAKLVDAWIPAFHISVNSSGPVVCAIAAVFWSTGSCCSQQLLERQLQWEEARRLSTVH